MNKEQITNHILIEVINNDGDLKLTKFRNPQAMWINNDYPDEYVFRDVDIVNIFQLIQENKQLKDNWNKLKEYLKNEINIWCCATDDYTRGGVEANICYFNKMQELEKEVKNK